MTPSFFIRENITTIAAFKTFHCSPESFVYLHEDGRLKTAPLDEFDENSQLFLGGHCECVTDAVSDLLDRVSYGVFRARRVYVLEPVNACLNLTKLQKTA